MNDCRTDDGAGGASARSLIDYAQRQADRATKATARFRTALPRDSFPGYVVVREVSRGGQGVVYEAYRESTKHTVAIKAVLDQHLDDGEGAARMSREIEVLSQLRHPNIVGIHDGGTAAGRRFFVMDYVDGVPLDDYVRNHGLDLTAKVRLFSRICEAVNAAHVRGVIHRDLKPKNILIGEHGQPQILDFGLAKMMDDVSGASAPRRVMTITGQFVGSLIWASPEQIEGVRSDIDTRTDVYALGLMLYRLVTGGHPYDVSGSAKQVMDNIVRAIPDRRSVSRNSIPDDLETIIFTCLKKNRDDRYDTAGAVASDLDHFLKGEVIDAKRDSSWYVMKTTLRKHRHGAVGVAALLLVGMVYAATVTVLLGQATVAQQRAREHEREQLSTLGFVARVVSERLKDVPEANDIRQSVLQDIYDRMSSQRSGDVGSDDESRLIRAETESQLGDIMQSTGNLNAALEHFRRLMVLREGLVADNPGQGDYEADLSISLVRAGDVLGALGDHSAKMELYERAMRIDVSLVERWPDDLHFQDNLSWSFERLGDEARRVGDYEAAFEWFDSQREIAEYLTDAEPDNALRTRALLSALRQLSVLADRRGDGVRSVAYSEQQLAAARRFAEAHPDDAKFRRELARSYFWCSTMMARQGRIEHSADKLRVALRVLDDLPNESSDALALGMRVSMYHDLGSIAGSRGDTAAAEEYHRTQLSFAKRLHEIEPSMPTSTIALFTAYRDLVCNLRSRGRSDEERLFAERAISLGDEYMSRVSDPGRFVFHYASFLVLDAPGDFRDVPRGVRMLEEAADRYGRLDTDVVTRLSSAYASTGAFERAIQLLEGALLGNDAIEERYRRGMETALEEYRAAVRQRETAVKVPPTEGS